MIAIVLVRRDRPDMVLESGMIVRYEIHRPEENLPEEKEKSIIPETPLSPEENRKFLEEFGLKDLFN